MPESKKAGLLLANRFFKNIREKELSQMDLSLFTELEAEKGEEVIREGTPGEKIYLLLEGEVVITKNFSDGGRHEIGTIQEGEFFGEMAIIEGRERSASVFCLTPCRMAVLNKDGFLTLIRTCPKLINNIASVMAHRLRESDAIITSVTERNLYLQDLNREISEREQELEDQKVKLELLNMAKDRFFTVISHDLKSPVTTIRGLSELLAEASETISPDQTKEFLGIISSASSELAILLDNLLQWAMAQTGRVAYSPESVNLKELTSETIRLLIPDAKAKKIELAPEIDERITACLDKNMISSVIRNVTSNAIKFTAPGGRVILKAEENDANLRYSICDTGVGISSEDIGKLFMIENHLTTKGTKGETGSGIGLILSKEFIDIHGGEIWAESEMGKGTSVSFTIPLNS